MTETAAETDVTPIVKTLTVACDQERAFTVFTREVGNWWPTDTHSLHPGEVEQVVWEEREGGSMYEIATSGDRANWATVLQWDPPHRLVIAWEVNPERAGTEVEVRFSAVAGGTLVELEHRGFENITDGVEMRAAYHPGWDHVLARYPEIAGALPSTRRAQTPASSGSGGGPRASS
jgi:uncharacterized protein YndB with AHSA1/START domain